MRLVEILVLIITVATKTNAIDDKTQIQSCILGDVVQNECLQCICTTNNIYKCTPKSCTKNYKENVLTKEAVKPTCRPNVVYSTNTLTCICDKTGYWPHSKCEEVFQTLNDTNNSCEPDSYVILDCNVCHCGRDGNIDKERCTENICEDVNPSTNTRRYTSNVYGSCEVKNWYSLAPCQFCFCIDQNKLVCNTGNYYAKKLDLGSYHLNVCGKGLIYEAIALLPDNDLSLRFGKFYLNNTTTTATKATTSKQLRVQKNKNFIINIQKGKERANNIKSNLKDTDDSSTESDEVKTETTHKIRDSTQFPYIEDADETSIENDYSDKKEPDSGMDIGVPETKPKSSKIITTTRKNIIFPTTSRDLKTAEALKNIGQNLGQTLKFSLPQIMDQMFKMALRKSMLSLNSDSKCVPGTTNVVKCNMCFCMKNGKLLCTNKLCDSA